MRALLPIALCVATTACASAGQGARLMAEDARAAPGAAYDAARRAFGPPQLSNVESPAPLAGANTQSLPQPQPAAFDAPAANSLWRTGARSFFNDQRASRVGDILTVNIEIADKAELTNNSARHRTANTSAGVSHFLGLETAPGRVLPGGFDPGNMFGADSDSQQSGQGSINREEKIRLTVAAVIVDVLPNGNLVIAGRQEARINAELRELTVSGVIRPEDIGADNTIRNDQMAEARISYGGRGQLSAIQRPSWGQRIADALSPW
ncbi:MAG: flagellar basal body L-ring protein FlgH [Hyphomonadaceae bacterium]